MKHIITTLTSLLLMLCSVPSLFADEAGTNTDPAATSGETVVESETETEAETEADAPVEPAEEEFNLLTNKKATGNWFGLRDQMSDMGIDWHLYWNQNFFSVMKGGERTNTLKSAATYDILMTLDLEKLGVMDDAEALIHAKEGIGSGINTWTGASGGFQVHDDNDGDRSFYVDQLWFRKHFADRKVSLQFGFVDFQAIVDRNKFANSEDIQFMNAALDNNPLFPTASATGLGAALTLKPCDEYSLILGVMDSERVLYKPGFSTAFHDEAEFLGFMEHGFHFKIPSAHGPLEGNYRFGLSYDPESRPLIQDPNRAPKTQGDNVTFYTSFDQMVYRESEEDDQGLGAFFRYAYRKDQVYPFNHFWSLGVAYKGIIPTRDSDTLGFAFAQQIDSDEFRRYRNARAVSESIFELYYSIQITPWLTFAPDIQYSNNPGGNGEVGQTIAGGFRFRATF